MWHVPYVRCYLSPVKCEITPVTNTCHLLPVTGHVSYIKCHLSVTTKPNQHTLPMLSFPLCTVGCEEKTINKNQIFWKQISAFIASVKRFGLFRIHDIYLFEFFFDIWIALGVFIPNTSWFLTDALDALILLLISAGGTKWAGIIFFSFFTFWTFFVWAGEHGAKNEFSCGIYVYPYAVAWYISR